MSKIDPELTAALALAETILQHGPDGADTPLSHIVLLIAVDTKDWLATTAPQDISIKETQRLTDLGQTKVRELIAAGVFEAFNDGPRVKVTSRSVGRRRIALAICRIPTTAHD